MPTLIPRKVGFDSSGKAVGAGFNYVVEIAHHWEVIELPSENVEFIDFDVRGKTRNEIEMEVAQIKKG